MGRGSPSHPFPAWPLLSMKRRDFSTGLCTLVLPHHLHRPRPLCLTNSSCLCLSPTLALGSDFKGAEGGAIKANQGNKALAWFCRLQRQESRLLPRPAAPPSPQLQPTPITGSLPPFARLLIGTELGWSLSGAGDAPLSQRGDTAPQVPGPSGHCALLAGHCSSRLCPGPGEHGAEPGRKALTPCATCPNSFPSAGAALPAVLQIRELFRVIFPSSSHGVFLPSRAVGRGGSGAHAGPAAEPTCCPLCPRASLSQGSAGCAQLRPGVCPSLQPLRKAGRRLQLPLHPGKGPWRREPRGLEEQHIPALLEQTHRGPAGFSLWGGDGGQGCGAAPLRAFLLPPEQPRWIPWSTGPLGRRGMGLRAHWCPHLPTAALPGRNESRGIVHLSLLPHAPLVQRLDC